jgi:transposase
MRMRHTMIEERRAHQQRIHAQLFHNGYPQQRNVLAADRRERLQKMELPRAARKVVDLSLAMIEHINEELEPIEAELRTYALSQAGCRALMEYYGIGELTSVAMLAELGDTRRFSSSKKAVRFAGLDVTVQSSDEKQAAGRLSRQGSPVLRWAAFEATKERIGTNRAALSIARKLIRRAHHTLRELGEEAMSEPAAVNNSSV